MMTLIIGGSGSGKSEYAEDYAAAWDKGNGYKKYYIATMKRSGSESVKRIARHRKLREGKGFVTIEQPTAVRKALKYMQEGEKTVLLECVSNLVANEMFTEEKIRTKEAVVKEVIDNILVLNSQLQSGQSQFVVVSNNVFEDGVEYDEATMSYIRAMGQVNEMLSLMADKVIEVVVGIPVIIKSRD